MSGLKKAELIEGIVYVPGPVRFVQHGSKHADLVGWLRHYKAFTPGVNAGNSCHVRLDLNNEPQPDALLFIDPDCGGQAVISDDDYIESAPEALAEVAARSASIDVHLKFRVYRRNGVNEYIVWRTLDRAIDWFILRDDDYDRLTPDGTGIYRSEAFPGLWLDAGALIDSNLPRVLEVLQQGLASPEHAASVAKLAASRKS